MADLGEQWGVDGSGHVVPAYTVGGVMLGVDSVADACERFINDSNVKDNEPGGTFTMG